MAITDAAATFDALDRELWIVTSGTNHRRGGLVATFVTSSSLVPELPRVCVGIARHHYTWRLIEETDSFALHLFGASHLDWVWRFGLSSGHHTDKFDQVSARSGLTGSPLLSEALAWMECRVEARCEVGDRTIYIAEVVDASGPPATPPLTVREMVRLAPDDRLAALKALRTRDSAIDSQAILAWRQGRAAPPGGEPPA